MAESMELDEVIDLIADWIDEARSVVAFTGAGMSTESGIPDFRSPGGIWSKYDPEEMTFQNFLAKEEVRRKRWRMFVEGRSMLEAKPNPGHKALADLESLGKLECLVTQNIDGLHQAAGNSQEKVVELHGTQRYVYCLDCGKQWPSEEVLRWIVEDGIEIPECTECGGLVKTATISFGQAMPREEMQKAEDASRNCDFFLVAGSTLVVQPAALMPVIAKQSGAKVVIVNLSETAGDNLADMILRGKTGEILPLIVNKYRDKYNKGAMA
jgi:NAD-dependent deacetylase